MNATTPKTAIRELDCRTNDGFEVRLLWNSLTDSVSVTVEDTRYGESFTVDVASADALDAFHHPFAYTSNDHSGESEPEPVPPRRLRAKDER